MFILSLILASHLAFGEKTSFKPVNLSLSETDTLVIRGFSGPLKITGREGATELRLKVSKVTSIKASSQARRWFEDWIFSYKREGNQLIVQVKGPQDKEAWSQLMGQKDADFPSFEVEVFAPSVKAKVFWQRGSVTLKDWKAPLYFSGQKGQWVSQNTSGDLQIFLAKGKANILKHEGSIQLDSYDAAIKLNDVKGEANIENFYGRTSVNKVDGKLKITNYKGVNTVSDSKGQVQFDMGLSPLNLTGHEGSLKGETDQGNIIAKFKGKANVRVKSKDGDIKLKLPNSGAWVNIGSKKGGLIAPSYLRLNRYPNIKTKTGQLRGKEGGSIFVRTETGRVFVQ